jgi:hypothetical protein
VRARVTTRSGCLTFEWVKGICEGYDQRRRR